MSLDPIGKSLSGLIDQLRAIDQAIDQAKPVPKKQQPVQMKCGSSRTITVRSKADPLKGLDQKLADIDQKFQKIVASKHGVLKAQYQDLFDQVLEKYSRASPPSVQPRKPIKARSLSIKVVARNAAEALDRAHGKVSAEKAHRNSERVSETTAQDLAVHASESTPLHNLYRVLNGTPAQRADPWQKLPFAQRKVICDALGISPSNDARIKELAELLPKEDKVQELALGILDLTHDERSLLLSRIRGLERFAPLAAYIEAIEEGEQEVVGQIALLDKGVLQGQIQHMVRGTVDASKLYDGFLMELPKTQAPAIKFVLPEEVVLLGAVDAAEGEKSSKFSQFYNEVLFILHQPGTDEQKRRALREAINRLPNAPSNDLRGALFGKIYELHPDRAPRDGWGERHAVDDFGILLASIYALNPKCEDPAISPLIADLQKILHTKPALSTAEQQKAIKTALAQAKKTLPSEVWNAFKGRFYQLFPGKEKDRWGWGGEEKVAHLHPYHLLLTLHSISHVYSRPEYWEGLRQQVRSLQGQQLPPLKQSLEQVQSLVAILPPSAGQPLSQVLTLQSVGGQVAEKAEENETTLWSCYDALQHCQQKDVLAAFHKSPFFGEIWRKSPLCAGLRSGEESAVDDVTVLEIGKRILLLEQFDAAKLAIVDRIDLDEKVWNALVNRIVFQPGELSETDFEEFVVVQNALAEVAKDKTYNPAAAKDILQMLIDLTSKRHVSEGLNSYSALTRITSMALALPLQGRPLDYSGPKQFKDLIFFKEGRDIIAKMKPMDVAMIKGEAKYKVAHLYREYLSSRINDGMGFKSTAPTGFIRITLGESVLKLIGEYRRNPKEADQIFQLAHPVLREALAKRLPYWDTASAQEKIAALEDFHSRTGATDLLRLMTEKLEKGDNISALLPMFIWLPADIRGAIYGNLFRIKKSPKNVPFEYGELAFRDSKPYSSTKEEKIAAIKGCLTVQRGLQPGYREEGLGSIQLWQANIKEVTSLLCNDPQGAQRLRGIPKERVDLYALTHLVKGHSDVHMSNTLLRDGTDELIDCDEEHCLPPTSDYNDQMMWELGLPAADAPIQPLLMHTMLHPHFVRSAQGFVNSHRIGDRGPMAPFRLDIDHGFKQPLRGMSDRVERLRVIADRTIKGGTPPTTRDVFFEICGGREEYELLKRNPSLKKKHAVLFEQHLGRTAPRVQPLRKSLPAKEARTYWANIEALGAR